MKIGVIGAGAIGNLVAAYLKLKEEDVFLAGTASSIDAIKKNGLDVSGVRGDFHLSLDCGLLLNEKKDLVILAAKTQDLKEALNANLDFIKGALLVTTQNGVAADSIAAGFAPKENIISSIVMFGATYLEPGKIVHNFEGSWILAGAFGKNNKKTPQVSEVLNKIFPCLVSEDIRGMKYLKIFVNANNCIPAVLGQSMQEAFSDLEISRISIAIWKEAMDVVSRSNIKLVSLPDFPLERLVRMTQMPISEAARIYSGIMASLSKQPVYGSILQSIKRKRASEIDYINGEFVSLAKVHNSQAPLNEMLVSMVHRVEKTGDFFSKEELLSKTKDLVEKI
ncbi:MAG: 2-dehydropantoate 2-reductase [Candidatus Omnitrophica bacterium]|jgi:2-dehydropantoate 2-reductase|nr:2-dehydropantoate 2-reductase [Candidatus Omnitrophota bacterium]